MAEIRAGKWSRSVDPDDLRDPRTAAIWVVERCLTLKVPADVLRARAGAALDERDRAFLHRLTTEVLRWLRRIDDVLARVGGRPIHGIDARLLGPLRIGAAQLLYFGRVPAHAAVSTSVDLAGRRTRPGARFVNALLRKVASSGGLDAFPVVADDPIERLALETSHRRFTVGRWVDEFGLERARRALEASNRDRPASLLAVRGRGERDRLLAELDGRGVSARASSLSPLGLLIEGDPGAAGPLLESGELHPQDEASQCAALVPPPEPGERVLDAAASPGGKTLSLLAWEPGLRVTAADAEVSRLDRLASNRRRSGASFGVVGADARFPAFGASFDRVLADLPCSGSGTFRKHPELKWRMSERELGRLAAQGVAMLDGLAGLVRPGGRLVVATCSLEPEENRDQVRHFLERHPDFELEDADRDLPESLRRGLDGSGAWRLLPGGHHDGFTVHVLGRRGA